MLGFVFQGDVEELVKLIQEQGAAGVKGYMKAFVGSPDTLVILGDHVLPAQPW